MYSLKYVSDNGKTFAFTHAFGAVITSQTGLTGVEVKLAASQGSTQVGETIQGQSIQGKAIVLNGEITGVAAELGKAMIDAIAPGVGGSLIYNNSLELRVIPQYTPIVSQKPWNAEFQITFRAAYPYWRAVTQTVFIVGGITKSFRFPVNYETPHIFGVKSDSLFANIINRGNVAAPFFVRFFARSRLTNPKIVKVGTDPLEFIRIKDKVMEAGEQITVDMTGDGLVIRNTYQGITTNGFAYWDMDSTVFKLDIGDNLIRYDADDNAAGLECRITVQPEFSGAYTNGEQV